MSHDTTREQAVQAVDLCTEVIDRIRRLTGWPESGGAPDT